MGAKGLLMMIKDLRGRSVLWNIFDGRAQACNVRLPIWLCAKVQVNRRDSLLSFVYTYAAGLPVSRVGWRSPYAQVAPGRQSCAYKNRKQPQI